MGMGMGVNVAARDRHWALARPPAAPQAAEGLEALGPEDVLVGGGPGCGLIRILELRAYDNNSNCKQ